jgi:hypothetical protein
MSGFMIVSSPPDQKSLSKLARIPRPWFRSKSVVGLGFGKQNCFSDVINQKAGLPVLDHLTARTEVHGDDRDAGGVGFDQDKTESFRDGVQVQ